jgi:hypothetical protein
MLQPSQLIPASQKTCTFSNGPSLVGGPMLAEMAAATSSIEAPATLPAWEL